MWVESFSRKSCSISAVRWDRGWTPSPVSSRRMPPTGSSIGFSTATRPSVSSRSSTKKKASPGRRRSRHGPQGGPQPGGGPLAGVRRGPRRGLHGQIHRSTVAPDDKKGPSGGTSRGGPGWSSIRRPSRSRTRPWAYGRRRDPDLRDQPHGLQPEPPHVVSAASCTTTGLAHMIQAPSGP